MFKIVTQNVTITSKDLKGFQTSMDKVNFELGNGINVNIPIRNEREKHLKATLNAIGLSQLKDSTVDFTTYQVNFEAKKEMVKTPTGGSTSSVGRSSTPIAEKGDLLDISNI